jgi:hypothetical protein
MKSHYDRAGRFKDRVDWIPPPHEFNKYQSIEEVAETVQDCDMVLFSSYIWNYDICDAVASLLKRKNPAQLLVLGGPHIGTHDQEFLSSRNDYDFICRPTKPGERFIESLLNQYFESNGSVNPQLVEWELRSALGTPFPIQDYSVYRDHREHLIRLREYARTNELEAFVVIETTRGCPFTCVYCEWGGGTESRILFKPLEVVKQDIQALSDAGFGSAYLTDSNFGLLEKRDVEIFRFAYEHRFALTDISTVKSGDLARRKRIIDAWFGVVGRGEDTQFPEEKIRRSRLLTEWETSFISSLPTVSIQSVSEKAMEIARRSDLSFEDKIHLSRHIRDRCEREGFPVPSLELIQAMPGSTLDDFYSEMEIIWNFKAWSSFRHDYMFLPDTQLADPGYQKRYGIELVQVYTELVDEAGVDNINTLYTGKKNYFYTIASCFSFTREEMKEIYIMNLAGNFLLKSIYPSFSEEMAPPAFGRLCYRVLQQLPGFLELKTAVDDLYDPASPPRSIKKILGKMRMDFMEEFINRNRTLIFNEIFRETHQNGRERERYQERSSGSQGRDVQDPR